VRSVQCCELVKVRAKALRRHAWFKLSSLERGLVNAVVVSRVVVRSRVLVKILAEVVGKLSELSKPLVLRMMNSIGRPIAESLSKIAQSWGYRDAWKWVEDTGFIIYLTVVKIHESAYFR